MNNETPSKGIDFIEIENHLNSYLTAPSVDDRNKLKYEIAETLTKKYSNMELFHIKNHISDMVSGADDIMSKLRGLELIATIHNYSDIK